MASLPNKKGAHHLKAELRHAIEGCSKRWTSEHPEAVSNGTQITGHGWVFSSDYPAFPSPCSYDKLHPIPPEIDKWPLQDIVTCSNALSFGYLDVEVFTGTSCPERAIAPGVATPAMTNAIYLQNAPQQQNSLIPNLTTENSTPYRSLQLRSKMRPLLLNTIRTAIGREIFQRNGHPINPKQDDERPPNLYKWKFSPKYPRFPAAGVGSWTVAASEACIEALDNGWLSVIALPADLDATGKQSPIQTPRAESVENRINEGRAQSSEEWSHDNTQSDDDASNVLASIEYHNLERLVHSLAKDAKTSDDISSLQESYMYVQRLMRRREAAVDHARERLKLETDTLSCVKDRIILNAESKISQLENTIMDQDFHHQRLKAQYEDLQEKLSNALEEISDLKEKEKLVRPLDDVAEARRLGEIEDLRTTIRDLRDERDAQLQRHLVQLKKVREDSWQDGYQQCRASVTKSTNAIIITDLKRQLKDVQVRHEVDVVKVREQGRPEDEEPSHQLEVPSGKKIKTREMPPIHRISKSVPQEISPKLSRVEGDARNAKALLEDRNAQPPEPHRDTTVTNAGISKVLSSLEQQAKARDSTTQRAPELSPTPQAIFILDKSPNSEKHSSSEISDSNQISQLRSTFSAINAGNGAHKIYTKRSSAVGQPAVLEVDHDRNDAGSRKRDFGGNVLNSEASSPTSRAYVPSIAMMAAGVAQELPSVRSQRTSLSIKHRYEEEEDIYGASPPGKTPESPIVRVNIARPLNQTPQETPAGLTNAKRQRLGGRTTIGQELD